MAKRKKTETRTQSVTNTKLALATAALFAAAGIALAFLPVNQVSQNKLPKKIKKCGLNSFSITRAGSARGFCYSGQKVAASSQRLSNQELRQRLEEICLSACAECPKGYEPTVDRDSKDGISCKKSESSYEEKSDPIDNIDTPTPETINQASNSGSCVDEEGNPSPPPEGANSVCRGHDGGEVNYTWSGPGPEAATEFCNPEYENRLPCSYRCGTGERVNPATNQCESFPFAITCTNEPESHHGIWSSCEDLSNPWDLDENSNNEWTYDANCSNNNTCTFECGDNSIINNEMNCEYCTGGFTPNANQTSCVCEDVIEEYENYTACIPCSNGLIPNSDQTSCVCPEGLYYSTQYHHCMSRESCVGGDDLVLDENARECHTCQGETRPNADHTACVCPPGLYEKPENGICWTRTTCEGSENRQPNDSTMTCDYIN